MIALDQLQINETNCSSHGFRTYVGELVRKFKETGPVAKKKTIFRYPVRTEAVPEAVRIPLQ